MYDIERKDKILEILHEKKSCSVSELAKQLMFSEATIRRDLNELHNEMKVRKTFGGAVIIENYSSEVPIAIRQSENAEIKSRLCRAALPFLHDNMTLFIPSSTTTEHILPYLDNYTGLTVITNCPIVSNKLANTDITVYCTGGKLLHHSNAYVGEFARSMIRKVNADLMLFSARGVSLNGKLTNSSTDDDVLNVMMENSSKTCVLLDSTKVGKTYQFTICNMKDVDVVITDKELPADLEYKDIIITD